MSWFDPASFPLAVNAALFAAAAAFVWAAGTRLSRGADTISRETGLGSALIGMLLLGGITSLPEIAVSTTAGLSGDAALAVNNILGGVAMQVAIIAVGDAALRGRALSSSVPNPTVLLQGTFNALMLCMVAAGVVVGEVAVLGVGAWSAALLTAAVVFLWVVARAKGEGRWRPCPPPRAREEDEHPSGDPGVLRRAIVATALAGLVIVVAGYVLARTGEALAAQTGLGSSFVGALFVGLATSLPEISTVLAAVRLRRYVMAFSDIFGTNIIDVALIFLIDVVYDGPPVLDEVGTFSAFAAVLGVTLVLLYLVGLVERRDRAFGRLGVDSWAVLGVYLAGLTLLYGLRGAA